MVDCRGMQGPFPLSFKAWAHTHTYRFHVSTERSRWGLCIGSACSTASIMAASGDSYHGRGMLWDERHRHTTESRLFELQQYAEKHGNADVPLKHPTGLGRWAAQQRMRWKRGKLSSETYRALCTLGFSFDLHDAAWMRRFEELSSYHSRFGHCRVHHAEHPGLYAWILVQRQLYRQGRLNDERTRRLEGLGFVWDPYTDRWEQRYQELKAFVEKHGHANVPSDEPTTQYLASWLQTMQVRWHASDDARKILTPLQEAKLRELGIEFD